MTNLHLIVSLISAIMVVTSINPIHSVLWLISVFINAAIVLVANGAEFLGLLFIVVYVGAIAVLFLFVVMMLNIKIVIRESILKKNIPLVIIAIFTFGLIMVNSLQPIFTSNEMYNSDVWINLVTPLSNVQVLGALLYTIYAELFITVSFILLVAMIGAIMLTLKITSDSKRQDVFGQISRKQNVTIYKINR